MSPKQMTTDDMSVLSDSTISKHQLQQQQQAKSSSVRTRQTQETTNGLLSSSPLNTSTRDRTPSIHSTASSIDTTSRNSLPSVEPQSTLRTDPIRIPMHYSDSCFIENLDHYEDMIAFAAKYDFINKADITTNPIYHPPDCHFNIDPPEFIHKKDHPVSEFEVAAAHDMQCVGHIIRDVYTAGNAKVLDNEVSTSSGYFEMGNGDIAYDIAPTGKIDVSL